tara:strand:- start:554 stop:1024 length:471 start_codon:yes stop_codon:yes gene_type:complete
MLTGSIIGLFATTLGGVPKPRVSSIEVLTSGVKNEVIRDKKHHGGPDKAVCLISQETILNLQSLGHPISGGSTGENILLDVPQDSLKPGIKIQFEEVAIEITMAATPCKTIQESFLNGDFTYLSNKRYGGQTRWYAKVLTEGVIHSNENARISLSD